MSVKAYRDLNPTARSQVDRAKTAAQSKNFEYAITLLMATLKGTGNAITPVACPPSSAAPGLEATQVPVSD